MAMLIINELEVAILDPDLPAIKAPEVVVTDRLMEMIRSRTA